MRHLGTTPILTLCRSFARIPHPATSTLFPYTTLFRSQSCALQRLKRLAVERERADRHPLQDRKSTRLNSSHVEISYAVFCLKKKTKSSRLFADVCCRGNRVLNIGTSRCAVLAALSDAS